MFNEENGVGTLTPVVKKEKNFDRLTGMYSDGRLSIDNFLRKKHEETEDEYLLALAEERLRNDSGITYAAEDVYAKLGIEDDCEIEVEID